MPKRQRGDCPQHVTTSRVGSVGGRSGMPIDDADPSIVGKRVWVDIQSCADCGSFVAAITLRDPRAGRALIMPMTALVEVAGGEPR